MDVIEFLKSIIIIGNKSAGLELDSIELQDIDNETDWKIAELNMN